MVVERGKRRDLAFCRPPDTHLLQNALPREPFRTQRISQLRPGTTSVPLRKNPGPSAKMSEGPARQVRVLEVGRDLLLHTEWVLTAFTGRGNS